MMPDPTTGQGDNRTPENNFGFPKNSIYPCTQCTEKDREMERLRSEFDRLRRQLDYAAQWASDHLNRSTSNSAKDMTPEYMRCYWRNMSCDSDCLFDNKNTEDNINLNELVSHFFKLSYTQKLDVAKSLNIYNKNDTEVGSDLWCLYMKRIKEYDLISRFRDLLIPGNCMGRTYE